MQKIVGVDFSYSCPCICIHSGDVFNLSNCNFFYLTDKKRFVRSRNRITGQLHSNYLTQEERIDNITTWALDTIPIDATIFLEGYSFGSRGGLAFNIGELGGVLKNKFYTYSLKFELVPPTVVKKFASGKGNAKKDILYNCFINETKYDLLSELNTKIIGGNPQSDIVDSYYLAKYGFYKK